MADLRGKIKINFKPSDFEKYALGQIAFNINQNILQNKTKIRKEIRLFVYNAIINEQTAKGLQDNSNLAYNLGIPIGEGEGRTRRIASIVSKSTYISFPKVRRSGKNIVGGIKIGIIIDDYSDVLDLADGVIITNKEEELHWLEWLLKEGGKILIPTHYVKYVSGNIRASRSKGAIMIKSKTGVGWRISPEYQGTVDDNWFTRAFEGSNESTFIALINSIVARYIDKDAVIN